MLSAYLQLGVCDLLVHRLLERGIPNDDFRSEPSQGLVDWSDAFFSENIGFRGWIELWARGADLWERLYGEGGLVATAIAARESTAERTRGR